MAFTREQKREWRRRPEVRERERAYIENWKSANLERVKGYKRARTERLKQRAQTAPIVLRCKKCDEFKEHGFRTDGKPRSYCYCYECVGRENERAKAKRHPWVQRAMNAWTALRRRGGKTAPTIEQLLELVKSQGFRCPYSGDLLMPDRTTWLDHKKPLSKGGTNAIENLEWTSARWNRSKSDDTKEEFIAWCRRVVRNHDRQKRRRTSEQIELFDDPLPKT